MPADSNSPFIFDPKVVNQLACPACLGGLSLVEDRLVCAECGRAYPVVDGIPVLIAGRAEESNPSE
ncbi:MAG: Trm112 family protein [Terracidiphilus sp.]|jgi:uncharacterized protein YbaR (Trm112 family)